MVRALSQDWGVGVRGADDTGAFPLSLEPSALQATYTHRGGSQAGHGRRGCPPRCPPWPRSQFQKALRKQNSEPPKVSRFLPRPLQGGSRAEPAVTHPGSVRPGVQTQGCPAWGQGVQARRSAPSGESEMGRAVRTMDTSENRTRPTLTVGTRTHFPFSRHHPHSPWAGGWDTVLSGRSSLGTKKASGVYELGLEKVKINSLTRGSPAWGQKDQASPRASERRLGRAPGHGRRQGTARLLQLPEASS